MRYTEYHNGVAVIKDKALLKDAMQKLAKIEDKEEIEGLQEKFQRYCDSMENCSVCEIRNCKMGEENLCEMIQDHPPCLKHLKEASRLIDEVSKK